jgi:hypothetical protein
LPGGPTCRNWSGSEENGKRSLKAVKDITKFIMRDYLEDVVTGCDANVVTSRFIEALNTASLRRNVMGEDTSVFIGWKVLLSVPVS